VSWAFHSRRELHAGLEYYWNQFAPALESSSSKAWSMMMLTVCFR
jgi:hypothetical protein